MKKNTLVPFHQAFYVEPVGKHKLNERDYAVRGAYPVIDQGQKIIAGFTDLEELLKCEPPYIVFGDHTRVVKYIDFPFVVGADGVRLFRASPDFDPQFLYYFLRAAEIPNDGYGRHFKYLQRLQVPLLPIAEQEEIVSTLTAKLRRVEDAIFAARKQLQELELMPQKLLAQVFRS